MIAETINDEFVVKRELVTEYLKLVGEHKTLLEMYDKHYESNEVELKEEIRKLKITIEE